MQNLGLFGKRQIWKLIIKMNDGLHQWLVDSLIFRKLSIAMLVSYSLDPNQIRVFFQGILQKENNRMGQNRGVLRCVFKKLFQLQILKNMVRDTQSKQHKL